MTDERRTYTVPEAAQILGVGESAIYEYVRQDQIPGALHVGRRILFGRAAFDAWVGQADIEMPKPPSEIEIERAVELQEIADQLRAALVRLDRLIER